jgi:hypothetical protein
LLEISGATPVAGALAGLFDPGYVFASLGLMWALFCAAQLFNRQLLRIENENQPAFFSRGSYFFFRRDRGAGELGAGARRAPATVIAATSASA